MMQEKIKISYLDIFCGVFMFYIVLLNGENLLNSNILMNIRFGEWMLDNKVFLGKDYFSTAFYNTEWKNTEWFYQLLCGFINRYFKITGVIATFGILISLVYTQVLKKMIYYNKDKILTFIMFVLMIKASISQWTAMPIVFNLIFFFGLYLLVSDIAANRGNFKIKIIGIFGLFVLWSNMGNTFIYGVFMILIYLTGHTIDMVFMKKQEKVKLKYVIYILIAIMVSFIFNPYGINNILFIFKNYISMMIYKSGIYNSPDFHGYLKYYGFFLVTSLFLNLISKKNNRINFSEQGVYIYFLILSLHSQKFISVAVIIIGLITIKNLNVSIFFSEKLKLKENKIIREKQNVLFVVLISILIFYRNGIFEEEYLKIISNWNRSQGIEFLMKKDINEKGFHEDGRGEMIIWEDYKNKNKIKVCIDTRIEIYNNQYLKEYFDILNVNKDWEEMLKKQEIKWILVQNAYLLNKVLRKKEDWKIIYDDKEVALFLDKNYYESIEEKNKNQYK